MTQMYLGEKPRKPYDVNKVRAAIKRCEIRMFDALFTAHFPNMDAQAVKNWNQYIDRWQEACICLMRLIPKEYPTADLS